MTRLCVHGLGYIGLATASLFANAGHEVVGFDTSERVRARLRAGDPHTTEADLSDYVKQALDGDFTISDEPVAADVHVICVPTPFDAGRGKADLAYVEAAGEAVAAVLRPMDTVVLESTVPPGTTRDVLVPILEASGLVAGEDFYVGHAPETVLPGNTVHELTHNDRIVGGIDDVSTATVKELYAPLTEGTVREAPDATTAEFVKLAQNAARDTQIAFANELALVAHDYGVDARAAIALANTHPRVNVLNPGPGVGGHCLPVDPLFLGQHSEALDVITAARRVNDGMTDVVVDRLESAVGSLDGRTVAILGVAYKGNVNDTRNSPGLRLAAALRSRPHARAAALTDGGDPETTVRLHDPCVADDSLDLLPLESALVGADAAIVAANHDAFRDIDPSMAADLMAGRVVVDPLAALDHDAWSAAGFEVVSL